MSNPIKSLKAHACTHARTHARTHTHARLMAIFPGLPRWAGTRKAKPIWILLKQETVCGSGISWNICKSAPRSRQITMPAPHHSVFLQAGCPSCRPTNSVKALKAKAKALRKYYVGYEEIRRKNTYTIKTLNILISHLTNDFSLTFPDTGKHNRCQVFIKY